MKILRLMPLFAAALGASANAQIVLGQVDTFTDGSTMFWGGGASPVNVPNGGPQGAGDKYLQFTGTGGFGPGSVPAVHNGLQWGGNWTAAGVKVVQVDFRNFSSVDLTMRPVLFSTAGTRWVGPAFVLPASSGWVTATYPIKESAFTRVLGADSWATTLAGVNSFMFRNQTSSTGSGGTGAAATVGMDNVRALAFVPAPLFDYVIELGELLGGNLNSLRASDNDSFVLLCDEFMPNAQVLIKGSSGVFRNPTSIDITVEAAASRSDLSLATFAYNFTTNTYTSLDVRLSSLTDVTFTKTIAANASQFVNQSTGEVRIRLRWIPTQDILAVDGWSQRVDWVQFALNP